METRARIHNLDHRTEFGETGKQQYSNSQENTKEAALYL